MASVDEVGRALSILIVEDEAQSREIMGRMVAMKFPAATVNIAVNGREGMLRAREHAPDVVVTDVNMPEVDGLQMVEQIRTLKEDVRVIVLSGYSDSAYLERFALFGVTRYVVKPIDYGKLFVLVEECLEEVLRGARNQ